MNITINSVRPLCTALDNRINRANRYYYHGKRLMVNNEGYGVSEHNERKYKNERKQDYDQRDADRHKFAYIAVFVAIVGILLIGTAQIIGWLLQNYVL